MSTHVNPLYIFTVRTSYLYLSQFCCYLLITRVNQKQLRVDTYLLRWLAYNSQIWHMHAMNCPASEYAKIQDHAK